MPMAATTRLAAVQAQVALLASKRSLALAQRASQQQEQPQRAQAQSP